LLSHLSDNHPNHPGLVVAAGGSGHAFKFAPVIGQVIADVLERKPKYVSPPSTRLGHLELLLCHQRVKSYMITGAFAPFPRACSKYKQLFQWRTPPLAAAAATATAAAKREASRYDNADTRGVNLVAKL
jgi:hypothetical protein